jgi:pyridoxine 4-dehydrogenase
MAMSGAEQSGTFALGDRQVRRLGFGAMQLSGPNVFGPPKDRAAAIAVLREAVASGVNHIDTSDYYGPHVTNQLIHEALHPYPDDLVIVTKVGARRGSDGSVLEASSPKELIAAVYDNLRYLGVDVLDVVNLRNMFGVDEMATDAMEEGLTTLATLQRQGLIRHIGLSKESRTSRFFRSAAGLRSSSLPPYPTWRNGSARHPRRSPLPGCSDAHQIFSLSLARRLWCTFERT